MSDLYKSFALIAGIMAPLSTGCAAYAATIVPNTGTLGLSVRNFTPVNVRDYGAVCDGKTDDTAALQAAIDVATGNTAASSALTAAQKSVAAAAGVNGVGASPNGGAKIVLGSGACTFSGTLSATLVANAGFAIVGDGTSNTQLLHTSGTGDGLDITFATSSTDISHSAQWPGQAIYLHGFNMQNGTGAQSGTAINIAGSTATSILNAPPHNVIEDVAISDTGGAGTSGTSAATKSGWTRGIVAQNVFFLLENRIQIVDDANFMVHGLEFNSTITASSKGNSSMPPGNLIVQDAQMMHGYGMGFLDISGYGIQAVYVIRPQFVTSGTGITWNAPANTPGAGNSSGSLVIEGGSGGATTAPVQISNIGTVFEHDDFWYPFGTITGNWYGTQATSVVDFTEHDDTVYQPGPPSGYQSYGTYFTAATSANLNAAQGLGIPNQIHHITVAGSGVGVAAQGANTLISDVICRGCSTNVQDLYTGSDVTQHPHIQDSVTGSNTINANSPTDTIAQLGTQIIERTIADQSIADAYIGQSGQTLPAFAASTTSDGTLIRCPSGSPTYASVTLPVPPNPVDKQPFAVHAVNCTFNAVNLTTTQSGTTINVGTASVSPNSPILLIYDAAANAWSR